MGCDKVCENGWNALHLAAMHGHQDICFLLVADLRFTDRSAQDDWGRTPLHCAAEHGHAEACQALITCGYNDKEIRKKDKWNRTAEEVAADDITEKILKCWKVS